MREISALFFGATSHCFFSLSSEKLGLITPLHRQCAGYSLESVQSVCQRRMRRHRWPWMGRARRAAVTLAANSGAGLGAGRGGACLEVSWFSRQQGGREQHVHAEWPAQGREEPGRTVRLQLPQSSRLQGKMVSGIAHVLCWIAYRESWFELWVLWPEWT